MDAWTILEATTASHRTHPRAAATESSTWRGRASCAGSYAFCREVAEQDQIFDNMGAVIRQDGSCRWTRSVITPTLMPWLAANPLGGRRLDRGATRAMPATSRQMPLPA